MANKGRGVPVAWCRDLSQPWDIFGNYLAKHLHPIFLNGFDEAVGITWECTDVSDECNYDYDEGRVTYSFHGTSDLGNFRLDLDSYIQHVRPKWFDIWQRWYVEDVLVLDRQLDGDPWFSGNVIRAIEYWDIDIDDIPHGGIQIETDATPWEMVPV